MTFVSPQAAQAGQTIVATQPAAVTPVIAATSLQKTVAGAAPLITNVTAATVAQAARIQVSQVLNISSEISDNTVKCVVIPSFENLRNALLS